MNEKKRLKKRERKRQTLQPIVKRKCLDKSKNSNKQIYNDQKGEFPPENDEEKGVERGKEKKSTKAQQKMKNR